MKQLLLVVLCLVIPVSIGCGSSDDERDAALSDSSEEEKASPDEVEGPDELEEAESPDLSDLASTEIDPDFSATASGSNLNRVPNVTQGCDVTLTPPDYYPTFARSCTYWTVGSYESIAESHIVPSGRSTLTAGRVRVGPTTGPMQFIVMRYLKEPSSSDPAGCCFPVGNSGVFTPTPNSVTEVPMNVPVRNEIDQATGIANFDTLAISVLAPNVPIPAYYTGSTTSNSSPFSGVFWPHVAPGTERTDQGGFRGYQILINGEYVPASTGGGGGGGGGGTTTTTPAPTTPSPSTPAPSPGGGPSGGTGNALTLSASKATVRGSKLTLPFTCNLTEVCNGYVKLQEKSAYARSEIGESTTRDSGGKLYASEAFEVPAGSSANIPFELYTAARKLFKKKRSIPVVANIEAGDQRTSQNLTLKRGR